MRILDEVLADIRQGEGCLRYDVREEVSGRIVLIEEWESRDHWQAHFDWKPIQRLKRELADKVIMPWNGGKCMTGKHQTPQRNSTHR